MSDNTANRTFYLSFLLKFFIFDMVLNLTYGVYILGFWVGENLYFKQFEG